MNNGISNSVKNSIISSLFTKCEEHLDKLEELAKINEELMIENKRLKESIKNLYIILNKDMNIDMKIVK